MPATFREIAPAVLTGAEATYLTVPSSTVLLVLEGWLCNTHTASVTVSIYAVESGGSATAARQIYADTIASKRAVPFTVALNLGASGTIRALASVANVVSLRLAPREIPA